MLILGDCLEKLKELKDNSVDSIVTDPPYGLSFMGKSWDYDVPKTEVWAECLRVLKPGGHLLSFFGTRTYHRGVVRIEDAGFEIRDMVSWLYGSGFPKSLAIGKQIDKLNGRRYEDNLDVAKYLKKCREKKGISKAQVDKYLGTITLYSWYEGRPKGTQLPTQEHYNKLKILLSLDNRFDKLIKRIEAERDVVGKYDTDMGGLGGERLGESGGNITLPKLEQAKQWNGWGTALKPSNEPIVLARKPLSEKNIALNVLKWGTGGINIDGCRVEAKDADLDRKSRANKQDKARTSQCPSISEEMIGENKGRFPANLIHDGSKEVVDKFPMTGKGSASGYNWETSRQGNVPITKNIKSGVHFGDSGSASRFFKTCEYTEADRIIYCAKASKAERNAGLEGFEEKARPTMGSGIGGQPDQQRANNKNVHPTVKPIKLMQYLVRLITPKGGTCLDPYTGSGTTGIACKKENFKFIGIEREEEYIKIAKARINSVQEKLI